MILFHKFQTLTKYFSNYGEKRCCRNALFQCKLNFDVCKSLRLNLQFKARHVIFTNLLIF